MSCRAYQASDQMTCDCGLSWDMNDPDPPHCVEVQPHVSKVRRTPRGPSPAPYEMKGRTPVLFDAKKAAAIAQAYEMALMEHRAMPHDARQIKAMRQALQRAGVSAKDF